MSNPSYCPQIIQLAEDFGYNLTFGGSSLDCCPLPPYNDPGVICDTYGPGAKKVLELNWTPTGKLLTGNFNNPNWAAIDELLTIDMSNQNLNGTMYDFPSNSRLKYFQIQGNRIGGTISLFSNSMINVDYSNNLITGTIPASFPGSVRIVNLNYNLITGTIPTNLGSLTSLNVGNNQLGGAIPSNLGNLIMFNFANNQLGGTFPTSFSNNLITVIANNNSLTGSLPVSLNRVTTLDVSFNLLSGVVPAVPSGVLLLKLQNNQFSSVGLLSASLSTTSCDISSNLFYSWSAPSWVGKCLMNNLLTTTNLRTTTTTKAATNLAKTTTQATKTISINQVVTTINTSLNTLPLSNWNTLADLPTTMVLIDSILEFPTTMPIETIDPRVYDLSRLSNSNTFTNSNTGEQPIATQIITTVFLADASLFSPIALIIIIFLLTIIIAGCSIEICLRQTKTKSGDARSFFSRNTRKDIRDAWKSFIPVPSRRNSKTTTIATTMSEKTFYKRQATEIN